MKAATHHTLLRPLRRKLLLPILLAGALLLGLVVLGAFRMSTLQLEARLQERARLLAAALLAAAENLQHPSELQRVVAAFTAEPAIESVIIVAGDDPRVIASSERRWLDKPLAGLPVAEIGEDLARVLASRSPGEGRWHRESDLYDWTTFCQPTLASADPFRPAAGAIMIHLNTQPLQAEVRQSILALAAAAVAGLALLMSFGYRLVSRHVLQPLAHVSGQLPVLATGHGAIDPGRAADDEIGGLVSSLNAAATGRRTQEAALQQAAADLEDATRERASQAARLQIIAQSPVALAMFDTEMRYLACSELWQRQYGLPPEQDLAGRSHYEVFPHLPGSFKEVHRRALAGESLGAREQRVEWPDRPVQWTNWECRPWRTAAGDIGGIIIWSEDVTALVEQRRAAEAALRESEAENRKLALAVARSHNTVILTDAEGRIEWVNEGFTRLTGYSAAEAHGRKPGDFLQGPETDPETVRRMSAAIRAGEGFQVEILNYTKAGRSYWILIDAQPLHDAGGRLTGFMGVQSDITERKLAEAALRERETQLTSALQLASAGAWTYDVAADEFTFDDDFYRIFRTTAAAVGGCRMSAADYARRFVHPEETDVVRNGIGAALAATDPHFFGQIEHRFLYADGQAGWMAVRYGLERDASGKVVRLEGVNQDITGRRQLTELLQQRVAERETLLQEVHHRVKNNLQVVSSLLTMQQQRAADQAAFDGFQICRDRVAAIALVHEQLYKSDSLERVDFDRFIGELGANILHGSGLADRVSFEVCGEGFPLDLKDAVPCALLLNELVTNALKHAFPDGRQGKVSVELRADADGTRHVFVRDDGVGLGQSARQLTAPLTALHYGGISRRSTLGLRLVDRLVDQLGAKLELPPSAAGTEYHLTLPPAADEDKENAA